AAAAVVPEVAVEVGGGPARAEGVDPDARRGPLQGERLGQGHQPGLGGRVRGQEGRAERGRRGDVDHGPAAAAEQVGRGGVADGHGRVEVEPHDLVPAGQAQVLELDQEVGPARVVDHDVEVAEPGDGLVHGRGGGLAVGQVGGDDHG